MTNITPEQRAAVKRVQKEQARGCGELTHPLWSDVQTILNLLPADLTNPQPELPTEFGPYEDGDGALVRLDCDGWHHAGAWIGPEMLALPLTRLAPERPTITREQIAEAALNASSSIGPRAATAIALLVNGKGAES